MLLFLKCIYKKVLQEKNTFFILFVYCTLPCCGGMPGNPGAGAPRGFPGG